MRPLPIVGSPSSSAAVLGAAIVRGTPSPVVDLATVLGGARGTPTRFVSLRLASRTALLAVEEVLGVSEFTDTELIELPPLLRDDSIGAVALARRDAELVTVLSASLVIPDQAWEVV